jgi:hypothetical protein
MMQSLARTSALRPDVAACSCRNVNPASRRMRKTSTAIWAIGFQLPGNPPSVGADQSAEELVGASASLLLYQSALKGKAGQAFLKVLLHLQNGSTVKLVEHYSEFFKELITLGVNWHDYLIDQLLLGSDNPFAKTAAKGECVDHFLTAVRHDLKVLQSLAISESIIAGWVNDTAYKLPSTWLAAAGTSANSSLPQREQEEREEALFNDTQDSPTRNGTDCIKPPLTVSQRVKVRKMISECLDWSDAAEMLARNYAAHDYGLVSLHQNFKWTGKSIQAQDVLQGIKAPESAIDHLVVEKITSALLGSLFPSELHSIPPHIAVYGCSHTAYVCTIASITWIRTGHQLEKALKNSMSSLPGLRLILLPPSKLSEISDLAWTMSQHPRVKFVVVCPQAPSSFDSDALMTLTGWDGFSFPGNAVFVACCNDQPPSSISPMVKIAVDASHVRLD